MLPKFWSIPTVHATKSSVLSQTILLLYSFKLLDGEFQNMQKLCNDSLQDQISEFTMVKKLFFFSLFWF